MRQFILLPSLLLGLTAIHQPAYAADPTIAELQTNQGTITIQLNAAKAPLTVKNFLSYAKSNFYKNTLFHRAIKNFVIQGGGVDKATGKFKTPNPPISNEANNGLSNLRGTIAMARTDEPNSATSQFFINLVDNKFLDFNETQKKAGYTVFGKVIKGLNIADRIGNMAATGEVPYSPLSEVISLDNVFLYPNLAVLNRAHITRITLVGAGKVTSLPARINCGTQCVFAQAFGKPLKLTATPAKGYQFAGWRGDCQGLSATVNVNTKKGNHNCTALFYKAPAST